jgi:hypothetical protein
MGETMGLDMMAFETSETPESEVDFWRPMVVRKLHGWREHHHLHEWMEGLYRCKGGVFEEFKLVPVALTREDLDELETAIWRDELPDAPDVVTDGSHVDDDMAFVRKARTIVSEGKTVFYIARW